MSISEFNKLIGLKSKKEVLNMAPKDAHWADLGGDVFYKQEDGAILATDANCGGRWFPSSMEADMLDENWFHQLRKPGAAAAPAAAPAKPPRAKSAKR